MWLIVWIPRSSNVIPQKARMSCLSPASYTALHSQNAVSAYFTNQQILPFGFVEFCPALQSKKAVSVYFASEKMLPFGFAEQYSINVEFTTDACWILWDSGISLAISREIKKNRVRSDAFPCLGMICFSLNRIGISSTFCITDFTWVVSCCRTALSPSIYPFIYIRTKIYWTT